MDQNKMDKKLKEYLTTEQRKTIEEKVDVGFAENQAELDWLIGEGYFYNIYLNRGVYTITSNNIFSMVKFTGIKDVIIKIEPDEEDIHSLQGNTIEINCFLSTITNCHIISDYCVKVNEGHEKLFINCSYNENITVFDLWKEFDDMLNEHSDDENFEIDQIIDNMSSEELSEVISNVLDEEKEDDLNEGSDLMKQVYSNLNGSSDEDNGPILTPVEVVKKYQERILKYNSDSHLENISFLRDIPLKKLLGAQGKYANIGQDEKSLMLIDITLFGTGKSGLLITDKAVYYKGSIPFTKGSINLRDVDTIELLKPSFSSQNIRINEKDIFSINEDYRDVGIAIINMIMDMRNFLKVQDLINAAV